MKRLQTTVLVALGGIMSLCAAQTQTEDTAKPPRSSRLGGLVARPGSLKGKIVIGNAQEKIGNETIELAIDDFRKLVRFAIEVKPSVAPDVRSAEKMVSELGGQVGLFIVDDLSFPTLLDAPENGWAIVNVAHLESGTDGAGFKKRARLEIVRGLSILSGAQSSTYPGSVMQPVRKAKDLDKIEIESSLPVDVASRFLDYLKAYGVEQEIRVQYRQAVKEGWAPEPTNEYQRVIWEKVKAEQSEKPTNPIKILPGDRPKGK